MTGSGLTVAEGTTPSSFTAEVVGVLPGGIAPGVDMILAELDSPAIDTAGGVWEGMSGSPVYSSDDRLIGAVAYGLADGGSHLAGLVPGAALLGLGGLPGASLTGLAAGMAGRVQLPAGLRGVAVRRAAATSAQVSSGMRRLRVPLAVSGLSPGRLAKLERTIPHLNDLKTVLSCQRAHLGGVSVVVFRI
ncbi:MAG: SpoIVB peptidase S55 domain-containing protein [Gemmatimonadaceae bacterium]